MTRKPVSIIIFLFLLCALPHGIMAQPDKKNNQQKSANPPNNYEEGVLIVIDGKIQGVTGPQLNLDSLVSPGNIEKINVLKDSLALALYGEKGRRGVIEIFLRGANLKKEETEEVIFEKIEIEPSFPGGPEAWKKFLAANVNGFVPVDNGAPSGTFKVVIKFNVSKEGKLDDFKPVTSHGFGMEAECIRILKLSPDWIPCRQNGRFVNASHEQDFTFVIEVEGSKKKKNKSH